MKSGSLKTIDYKGRTINSFKLSTQVTDFDVSFEDNLWIIGSKNGNVFLSNGLNQLVKKYSFNYYKGLSSVVIDPKQKIFLLGSDRGIGGVYKIDNNETIVEIAKGFSNFQTGYLFHERNVYNPMWISNSTVLHPVFYHVPFTLKHKKKEFKDDVMLINPGRDAYSLSNSFINCSSFFKEDKVLIYSQENKIYGYSLENHTSVKVLECEQSVTALYVIKDVLIIGYESGKLMSFSLKRNMVENNFKPTNPSAISSISSSLNGDTIFYSNAQGVFTTDFFSYKRLLKESNIGKIINNPISKEIGVLKLPPNVSLNPIKECEDCDVSERQKIKDIVITEEKLIILTYSGKLFTVTLNQR